MNTLEEAFASTERGEKYYIIEKTERLSHEDYNKGVEPKVEIGYCSTAEEAQKILDEEKKLERDERKHNYRVFEKKKEEYSFIQEMRTMNQIELIGWLS